MSIITIITTVTPCADLHDEHVWQYFLHTLDNQA